jgi:hypothetical protein
MSNHGFGSFATWTHNSYLYEKFLWIWCHTLPWKSSRIRQNLPFLCLAQRVVRPVNWSVKTVTIFLDQESNTSFTKSPSKTVTNEKSRSHILSQLARSQESNRYSAYRVTLNSDEVIEQRPCMIDDWVLISSSTEEFWDLAIISINHRSCLSKILSKKVFPPVVTRCEIFFTVSLLVVDISLLFASSITLH